MTIAMTILTLDMFLNYQARFKIGVGRAIACGHGCENGCEGSCGGVGGILLFSPTVWAGSRGGGGGTHTVMYTRMLHLPFSNLLLKSARN